jgi:hypothetical protein
MYPPFTRLKLLRPGACASVLMLVLCFPTTGGALSTSERVIHTFSWGDRSFTCLNIDGGQVPLPIPPVGGPKVSAGSGVSITWPADGATATIRDASKSEAGLFDLLGKPEAADAWKDYMVSRLRGKGYSWKVGDIQPDFLDVNHWRMAAMTMDYALGGRISSSILILWRCIDGSTLAVAMESDPKAFKNHLADLRAILGGTMLVPPGR